MLVESLEGPNKDAAILKAHTHPVVDMLEHLVVLADGHGE